MGLLGFSSYSKVEFKSIKTTRMINKTCNLCEMLISHIIASSLNTTSNPHESSLPTSPLMIPNGDSLLPSPVTSVSINKPVCLDNLKAIW